MLAMPFSVAFADARRALDALETDGALLEVLDALPALLGACFRAGGKVLICGNGGSMCDAMHFAEELTGRFRRDRPALPAIALADPAHLTCVGNDYGFEQVFSRAVEAYGRPGDVLIVLSTSGNSPNIVRALETAKARGVMTIALLGRGGGRCRGLAEREVIVPAETSERIQELHMVILHELVAEVERIMFPA
jgi:D-sedoheptulose 7-phosphate isomerase